MVLTDIEIGAGQASNRDYPGLLPDIRRRSMEYNKLTAINFFTVSNLSIVSVSCHQFEQFFW